MDLSATRIIPDLPSSLVEQVRTKFKERLAKKPEPSGLYLGCPFYVFGDDRVGYIILSDKSSTEVIYFVRFTRVRLFGNVLGRQVLVWRLKSHASSTGFAGRTRGT